VAIGAPKQRWASRRNAQNPRHLWPIVFSTLYHRHLVFRVWCVALRLFGGQLFESTRYRFLGGRSDAQREVPEHHRTGSSTTCFVDPDARCATQGSTVAGWGNKPHFASVVEGSVAARGAKTAIPDEIEPSI
jgi:hypothetical protein